MSEKYSPKKSIEKKSEKHKIFFVKGKEDYEDMCDIGLGSILHNQLLKFLERKETNGFYILKIKDPNSERKYKIEIKYEGNEELNQGIDETKRWKCLSCGTYICQEDKPKKCFCGGKKFFEKPELIDFGLLEKQKNKIRNVRLSGKLHDGVHYWTTFFNYQGEYVPIVLTENNKKIQVMKNELNEFYFDYQGENYRFEEELFFKSKYRINTIDNNVFKKLKKPIKAKQLYKRIKDKVVEYYDHSNVKEYDLLIPFIIISYIQWGLGKTYYLILQGKEDTGKSTLQILMSLLQMNGYFCGKSSIAVGVRLKHFFGIANNQDEFEKMSQEEKKSFMGVANTGFNINGTYNFVNTNKKNVRDQIQILNTFGTNSFSVNSLNLKWDFDPSFISRCYQLITTRKNRSTKDIYNLSEKERQNFQDLRNEIFAYCLLNYSAIEKDIKEFENILEESGTFGRKADLYSIILGILKHFKEDVQKEHQEIINKENLSQIEYSDSIESTIFNYIAGLFTTPNERIPVLNKDIYNFVNLQLELSEDKKIHSRTIGAILRKFNLINREEDVKRIDRGYEYFIGIKEFADQMRRFGYKKPLDKIKTLIPEITSLPPLSSLCSEDNEDSECNEYNEQDSKPLKDDQNTDSSKSRIKEVWKRDKKSFCCILESALLNFEGVSEKELITKYNLSESLVKAGINLSVLPESFFRNKLDNSESILKGYQNREENGQRKNV